MKKKIICALFAAVMAAVGCGCSSSDIKVSFDSEKPWGFYEVSTYKIERIYVGGKEPLVVAEGEYVSTLTSDGTNTTVVNEFSMTYGDLPEAVDIDEHGKLRLNKGLTDSYRGEVTFDNETLTPISAGRVQQVAQRPLNDDPLPEKQYDSDDKSIFAPYHYSLTNAVNDTYADPRSYGYKADYTANTCVYNTTAGTTSKDKKTRSYKNVTENIKMKDHTRYDNEQLYYLVRALQNVKTEGAATFYLTSAQDSYAQNGYIRHTMSMSCKKSAVRTELCLSPSEFTLSSAEGPFDVDEQTGKYVMPCIDVEVSISASKPGPPLRMKILDPSITVTQKNGAAARKLITEMSSIEYAYSAREAYKTVLTLVNFTASASSQN